MTDRTYSDSGRATDQTHIIRYALELGLLWIDGDGRDKVREALDALNTLEAQLEAIGAGGVSGPLVGRAALSANAGEPRALNPRHIRKFLQALQAGEMSVSRAVEILDAWVGGYYEDEMVPLPPPDSCLIADDEFPMEIVRKLRSELAAAPPTAQAEGWVSVEERLPPPFEVMIVHPPPDDYCCEAFCDMDGNWKWAEYEHNFGVNHRPCTVTHWKTNPPPTSAEGVEHG